MNCFFFPSHDICEWKTADSSLDCDHRSHHRHHDDQERKSWEERRNISLFVWILRKKKENSTFFLVSFFVSPVLNHCKRSHDSYTSSGKIPDTSGDREREKGKRELMSSNNDLTNEGWKELMFLRGASVFNECVCHLNVSFSSLFPLNYHFDMLYGWDMTIKSFREGKS